MYILLYIISCQISLLSHEYCSTTFTRVLFPPRHRVRPLSTFTSLAQQAMPSSHDWVFCHGPSQTYNPCHVHIVWEKKGEICREKRENEWMKINIVFKPLTLRYCEVHQVPIHSLTSLSCVYGEHSSYLTQVEVVPCSKTVFCLSPWCTKSRLVKRRYLSPTAFMVRPNSRRPCRTQI